MRRRRQRMEPPHLAPDPKRARRRMIAERLSAARAAGRGGDGGRRGRMRRDWRFWLALGAPFVVWAGYRLFLRHAAASESEAVRVGFGMLLGLALVVLAAAAVGGLLAWARARRSRLPVDWEAMAAGGRKGDADRGREEGR